VNATLLAVVLASAVSAPAPATEPIKPPMGLPPAQVIATMTKEGDIEITQTVIVPEIRTEKRVVVVGAKAVEQTVQVTVFRPVQQTQRIKTEGVKVYTAGGKDVAVKDLAEKLKTPTIVLVTFDGNKVDPFYLKIIKPDILVIVAPSPTPQAIGEPIPPLPEPKKP